MSWVDTRLADDRTRFNSPREYLETLQSDGLVKDFYFDVDQVLWFVTLHSHPLHLLALSPAAVRGFYFGCALGVDATIEAVAATS